MLLNQSVGSELLGTKARTVVTVVWNFPKNEMSLFEICMDFLLKEWEWPSDCTRQDKHL